jgi:carbonic anhydrase/acetyltransferase-like protein (isoleucine patch superfamily)
MGNKKYMITDESFVTKDGTYHRIKALINFGDVKADQLGGWIENKKNLSQKGTCWINEDAIVCGKAKVSGNAIISGKAIICGKAKVYGDAVISGNTMVYGYARIYGNAKVHGTLSKKKSGEKAEVFSTIIGDFAMVYGNALVYGEVKVLEYGRIFSNASVLGTDLINAFFVVSDNTAKIDGLIVSQEDLDKYMVGLTKKL